jgi:protease I
MTNRPLEGKKIAVLVESEFIPEEIRAYREEFSALGAEVHLMSRLWGNPSATFVSDVTEAGQIPETLEVNIDLQDVQLEDYAAVIMAANYTSVRLRYVAPMEVQTYSPDIVRAAPAVKFYAQAMGNPRIVKGALCHGLWILTPNPELLRGRKVICHQVVLADILNCGAQYIPPDEENKGVVVDDDLVTGRSREEVIPFIHAIAQRIQRL